MLNLVGLDLRVQEGTQAARLVEKYHLVHLSTGDTFRSNMLANVPGQLAKSYIDRGNFWCQMRLLIGMLEAEVNSNANAKGFIFDGFPRTTACSAFGCFFKLKRY